MDLGAFSPCDRSGCLTWSYLLSSPISFSEVANLTFLSPIAYTANFTKFYKTQALVSGYYSYVTPRVYLRSRGDRLLQS